MKAIYILIVLLVAASGLGCVDKTAPDGAVPESQPQTAVSPDTAGELDEFGMESDLEMLDSMFNDTEMDISFEVSADAFT